MKVRDKEGGPNLAEGLRFGDTVGAAVKDKRPVVALETAVATHGLPHPMNLSALDAMRSAVEDAGAVAATCLLYRGQILIGASLEQVEEVAADRSRHKASVRDLGLAMASGGSAGLTVSASLWVAHLSGIKVFATGGIGGVHLGDSHDVSADLKQLACTPVITVCSGAKSVLDLRATLEELESLGVPVFSYRTREFPAFYLRASGLPSECLDSVELIGSAAEHHWELGLRNAVVVANPIPEAAALAPSDWEEWLNRGLVDMKNENVTGKAVTPYLLDKVAHYSRGRTVEANVALLESNARLAGDIAVTLAS